MNANPYDANTGDFEDWNEGYFEAENNRMDRTELYYMAADYDGFDY